MQIIFRLEKSSEFIISVLCLCTESKDLLGPFYSAQSYGLASGTNSVQFLEIQESVATNASARKEL